MRLTKSAVEVHALACRAMTFHALREIPPYLFPKNTIFQETHTFFCCTVTLPHLADLSSESILAQMLHNSRAKNHYREVTHAAWLGLYINLGLGLAKLFGGIIGNSFALIADAVNSLGDVVTTVVVLFSLRVAQMPADDEHPYGHTRAEGVAAYTVSLLIIGSALVVGWEAIQRSDHRHSIPPIWTLWIAGANVLIKEGLYRYKLNVGRRTGSTAIIANAWDHRSDALCAGAVLIGLSVIRWGGDKFVWADEAASLVVVVVIVWSGVQLLRRSSSELLDVQAEPEVVENIRTIAKSVPGVRAIEKLWVRKSGLEFFVDIHLHVEPTMTVADGHEIGHRLKDHLMQECSLLRDVLVHLEPAEIENRP